MKASHIKILIVFALLFSFENYAQNTVTTDDLKPLLGKWSGTLTYIDYSSSKPYTMPANLNVKQGKNDYHFLLFNSFPNEPKANNKEKLKISKNGEVLNNHVVTSKQQISDERLQITTEYSGKDNNKQALIRNIYILGENQFVIRKEVKYINSEEWLIRNEFEYVRL
jgi:hypothetical protein